jgi:hypothetical protein
MHGAGRRQRSHFAHYLGGFGRFYCLGWRRQGNAAPLAYDLLQSVPLFRLKVAQLILHVIAVLARKIHQVLGVDVQFARQGIDSNFLSVLVQAG